MNSNNLLISQSLTMAQIASAAYDRNCRSTLSNYGFDSNYQSITDKHTYVHLACNSTEIVIAFKGTNNQHVTDWLADADLWPHTHGSSWVHRGFKRRGELLLPRVLDYILQHPNKQIYITGHSLGGAIGLYIAGELEQHEVGNITLYSFGCPRVGNKKYVDLIKSTHHRFVNCTDFVPNIPLSILGYRHHGTLHYLNFYGELRDLTIWQRIKDQFRARWIALRNGRIFDSWSDHKIASYIKKLTKLGSISKNQIKH